MTHLQLFIIWIVNLLTFFVRQESTWTWSKISACMDASFELRYVLERGARRGRKCETITISRRYSADVMEHASPVSLASVITRLATTPEGSFAYFRIPPAILRPTCARHARWLHDANFTRAGQGLAGGLPPSRSATKQRPLKFSLDHAEFW